MQSKLVGAVAVWLVTIAAAAGAQASVGPIAPGDLVYVEVYRVPELTTTVQVDAEGQIRLPYVGEIAVGGLSEQEAAARVSGSLKSILRNPRVTVSRGGLSLSGMSGMTGSRTSDMRMEIVPLHNANAENMASVLRGMSSAGGHISYDGDTNTLLVTDTPEAVQNIMNIVARMDQMQSQLTQVRIETRVAEVQVGAFKELGIRWFVQGDELGGGFYPPATQLPGLNNLGGNFGPTAGEAIGTDNIFGNSNSRQFIDGFDFDRRLNVPVQVPLPGQAFLGYANAGIDVGAMLDALVSNENAEVLANPMIVTVNHKTARIKMVDEFPILELATDLTGVTLQSYDFLELGIVLDVTPHVYEDTAGTYVKMELNPEVSFPTGFANGVPIRSVRSSETVASVRDGQTLVVGGIMRDEDREIVTKVAGLGDVPILGYLFKHKEKQDVRRELMIFVTPSVHRRPEEITWDKMIDVSQHLRESDLIPAAELGSERRKD